MQNEPITQSDLKAGLSNLRESLEFTITANTREIIGHFNKSQGFQNERMEKEFSTIHEEFAEVRVKLDAITEMLAMRQEMRNLIRELRSQGLTLDESKIFVV